MKKLKIAVIWEYNKAKWTSPVTHDGLMAAMEIIGKKHEVDWFLEGDVPDNSYDWIMPWGVGSIPFNQTIEKYTGKKALLCAGHPQDTANLEKFDAVFVESPMVYKELLPFCKRVEIAFGTDTDFFKPNPSEPKMFDVFYAATFSEGWKRQSLFAQAAEGYRACAIGSLQPDGVSGYQECIKRNVYELIGLAPTRLIALLYQMSKVCVITAWHGSERSILESLASNVPLVLVKDNELGVSLAEDQAIIVDPNPLSIRAGIKLALQKTNVNTRDWVINKYSHRKYAEKIMEVIES